MKDLDDVKRQLTRFNGRAPYLSKIYGPDPSFTPVVQLYGILEASLTPAVVFAMPSAPDFETWCGAAEDVFDGKLAPQKVSEAKRRAARLSVAENNDRAKVLTSWRHAKSGGEYVVRMHVIMADTLEPAVVYYKRFADPLETWIRPAEAFFDGRFSPQPTGA